MNKPKILFFGRLPPPFNGENIVSQSILTLLNDKYEITVIDITGNFEKRNGLSNKIKYYINQVYNLLRSYSTLSKKIKEEKFDFFYFSASPSLVGHYGDYISVKLARKRVSKIVCHVHNGRFGSKFTGALTKYTSAYLAKEIDKFIFLGSNLSNDLKGYIDDSKRVISSNPISKELMVTDEQFESKLKVRVAAPVFVITYLSNFILSKGYMELIGALEILPEEIKRKIKVRFIGKWIDAKESEQAFFNRIAQPDLAAIVEYIGPVYDRIRIREYLLESDVFCLPTYYPVEAQPVSIIEAMNAGNAIISTLHASIPEYIENGIDGYLVHKQNKQELAEAITRICDRQVLNTFAKNARAKFQAKFNDASILNGLLSIFKL